MKKQKISTENKIGMFVIGSVILILILVLLIESIRIKKKTNFYEVSNEELSEQIQVEKDYGEYINHLPEQLNTREYVEKLAREKLGLAYRDEIIFKPKKEPPTQD